MANYNRVMLMGNLVRDPELKYIQSGAAVCNASMAINRKYKRGEEWKTDVCYVKIVVWAKQAESFAKYKKKGDPIFVEGRLQSRSWETDDGQKRSVLEVVADRVQFLHRAPKREDGQDPGPDDSNGMVEEARKQGATFGDEPPLPGEDDVPF